MTSPEEPSEFMRQLEEDLAELVRKAEAGEDRTEFLELIRPLVGDLVYDAFVRVDRRPFVPTDSQRIFANHDFVIGLKDRNSSISQPTLVAEMINALNLTGKEKVLDVGTASGWSSALLSHCASHVDSIEIQEDLALEAQERLRELGFSNIDIHVGDGALGLASGAPYDAILVSACVREVPGALIDQLAQGGRIVLPVGNKDNQKLVKGVKGVGGITFEETESVTFMPLLSAAPGGWSIDEFVGE